MDKLQERDCTSECRSVNHAKQILNCVAIGTPSEIRSYVVGICHNFPIITDDFGRNLLHVASSCGKWEIVEWLLKHCNVNVDVKDAESGWSALHRSFFYGQITSTRILCNYGANLHLVDREGLTPLDVLRKDRLPYIEYIPTYPSDAYVWGLNTNYTLGLGKLESRADPEIVEHFHRNLTYIKQVLICKYHSVFLTHDGHVFTCGNGRGGRLGQGTEDVALAPTPVKGLGMLTCIQLAAGEDHLLLLLDGGQVWSCGLNNYHQLGIVPAVDHTSIPRPVSLKLIKDKVIGVRAAKFHSVIFTKDSVYTFGLNAGQLGHLKGERTQLQPRQVSKLFNERWTVTHVETSDGAIVCATSAGDIYMLYDYKHKKIASRQFEIQKLSVVGGHLDSEYDVGGLGESGDLELKILMLTKSGKVFLWQNKTDPYLRRCLFSLPKQIIISDIHINHTSIGLITLDNEGYMGTLSKKPPPIENPTPKSALKGSTKTFNSLLDREDCVLVKVKRLRYVHRGIAITSDVKGSNFAVLQSTPSIGVTEIPEISRSQIQENLLKFLSEAKAEDCFHDIIVKIGKREFVAHKYILASRSAFFRNSFDKNSPSEKCLIIEGVKPEVFEQILQFIYSNHCDFIQDGFKVKQAMNAKQIKNEIDPKSKSHRMNLKVLKLMQEASRRFNLNYLTKRLDDVKLVRDIITIEDKRQVPDLAFDRTKLSHLADVSLCSNDKKLFHCHKCILVSRLDYFRHMLNTSWSESSKVNEISLPIPSDVMKVVLDYLYTDSAAGILASHDATFLCQVLCVADQLIIPRLKEFCEVSLTQLVSLKNITELLEISCYYNSNQLKQYCMEFICINLPAIVEMRALDDITEKAAQDLNAFYRNLVPSIRRRRIEQYYDVQFKNELMYMEEHFPISDDINFCDIKSDGKKRNRTRTHSLRFEKNIQLRRDSTGSHDEDIVLDMKEAEIKEEVEIEIKINEEIKEEKVVYEEKINEKNSESCSKSKPGQWIMRVQDFYNAPDLDKIMQEEKNLISVKKPINSHSKKIPHVSQRQKKHNWKSADVDSIVMPQSPPNQNHCPWAKSPPQSPTSPSFWDTLARKELHCGSKSPELKQDESVEISLDAIQKAEEKKLRSLATAKVKPLHLINIEDKAIEELIAMYNARDNPEERVTVSRILPENMATPVWKKHS